MDSQPSTTTSASTADNATRRWSSSQTSTDSHTAADFIKDQLQLEADAREALPYKISDCTKALGPLRQIIFSCLTCNPPSTDPTAPYPAAGVCYSCSIQCHGDHELVELFNKRDFVCDCGTTRLPATSPCVLRADATTNTKGNVHLEPPHEANEYNHNFRNRFCGCACEYDAQSQKGTMFQCLGLGNVAQGGCGEDWWHPGCIMGLDPGWEASAETRRQHAHDDHKVNLATIAEADENASTAILDPITNEADEEEDAEAPVPPGFPAEDDFEGFICYKCVDANPWIKKYAGASGFLPAVAYKKASSATTTSMLPSATAEFGSGSSKKRQREDDLMEEHDTTKRARNTESAIVTPSEISTCKLTALPPSQTGSYSLFFKEDFREHLCRCSSCFPLLAQHPQLLEQEDTYEPSLSSDAGDDAASTVGSGSIYDRGESALKNIDRVRAIEGVMAYNHLKEKLTPFFQEFAGSGKAISADDIKGYFAKLRGDDTGMSIQKDEKSSDSKT